MVVITSNHRPVRRGLALVASLSLVVLITACSGNPWAAPDQPFQPPPGAAVASSGAASPAPAVPASPGTVSGSIRSLPLEDLAPGAAAIARERSLSVSVIVPGAETAWGLDQDRPVDLASVAKLLVIVEAFDRRDRQDRPLLAEERTLLQRVITESDNEAASTLWASLGGRPALADMLQRRGIEGFIPDASGHWGLTGGSAHAVSRYLLQLTGGEVATPEHTAFARTLLTSVAPAQRFGVGEVLEARLWDLGTVGVKNGWLQQETGWMIVSSAVILDPVGRPLAAVTVTGNRFPTLAAGVEALNEVTRALAQPLRNSISRRPAGPAG